MNIDLVVRSRGTYALSNAQPTKEFFSMIKASEYNVVNQLKKLPTQISLLELFQTSVKHQKALMKVLSEVHVPKTIEHDKLEEIIGSILLKDQIAFSND